MQFMYINKYFKLKDHRNMQKDFNYGKNCRYHVKKNKIKYFFTFYHINLKAQTSLKTHKVPKYQFHKNMKNVINFIAGKFPPITGRDSFMGALHYQNLTKNNS